MTTDRLPQLEVRCDACDGVGVVQQPDELGEIGCGECDGMGRKLTDAGQILIAFLARRGLIHVKAPR